MFTNILEKKIKNELSKALSFVKNKKQFSLNDVLLSDVSEFTKQFIRQEVIKDIQYTTQQTETIYDNTTSGLVLNMTSIIDKENLNKIVEKSIKLQFNYTIRPRWTLINYLFGKLESATIDSVRKKLTIFSFYKYYLDTIINYINDRPDTTSIIVTKSRVKSLLDNTDTIIHDKLLTNPSSVKVKNFFLQLFKLKYEDIYQPKLDDTIPFGFIRIFLEDKAFYGILDRFMQFYNYIYDELSDEDNLYDSKEIKLKDIIKIITGQVKVEEAEIKYITPDLNNDYLFLTEDAFEEKKKEDINLKTNGKVTNQKIRSETGKDYVLNYFTKDEIDKIQRKVFKNNKVLLIEFFERIKDYSSWEEVSEKLKTVFENNKVDIYDEEVVSFVNKLNDYYF